jgi:hypothetical protein
MCRLKKRGPGVRSSSQRTTIRPLAASIPAFSALTTPDCFSSTTGLKGKRLLKESSISTVESKMPSTTTISSHSSS